VPWKKESAIAKMERSTAWPALGTMRLFFGIGRKDHAMGRDKDERTNSKKVVRFPISRKPPKTTPGGFKDLGTGAMARHLNMRESAMTGHWCSHCRGVWFGYALEVECPRCGNRHG
jgi:hypothetical protein